MHPSSNVEFALTLLGPSAAMAQLWTQVRRLAPHVRTVLLTGEPDCGQEAVARLLLDLSTQNHREFLRLTAADAEARLLRPTGLVSFPADVLLYLPDVHRLSLEAQEALLRLIRMRRARPFTVVAATHEDLRALVSTGHFLADLAELISPVRLAVPALRQRSEDIPMLLSHMLQARCLQLGRASSLQTGEDFLRAAMQHLWSGNLRELSQVLTWLCANSQGDLLRASDLQTALAHRKPTPVTTSAPVRMVTLEAVMQEHLLAVLRACRGNKLRAAEVLGISRSTLYRMLETASTGKPHPLSLAS